MKKLIPYIYLILSLAGLIAFYYVNKGISQSGGFSIGDFIGSIWTDNFYARSITADFWVGALAGITWMIVEGVRLKMRWTWVFVVLSFGIAFAFAFPLFLFFRHRKLIKGTSKNSKFKACD